MKAFEQIPCKYFTADWQQILAFMLHDQKFDKTRWTPQRKTKLTKQIKGLFKKEQWREIKLVEFANTKTSFRKTQETVIMNGNGCQDFFRHIRNAIAHGRFQYINDNICFVDYTDSTQKQQTAYIYMSHETFMTCIRYMKQLEAAKIEKKTRKAA